LKGNIADRREGKEVPKIRNFRTEFPKRILVITEKRDTVSYKNVAYYMNGKFIIKWLIEKIRCHLNSNKCSSQR